jgi:predicted outer membrane repeat protein
MKFFRNRRLANQSRLNEARKPRARLGVESLEDRLAPAVFTVNSFADLLNPPPGTVTLRSAIEQANATPGGNTINLTLGGTYKIGIPGSGEDANASGDFDILASGGNLTINNTSGGRVVIDGNGLDRVFDINPTFDANNPTATAPFKVTLQGVTIEHGVAAPFGDGTMGGGGIRDTGNASLELDNCIVTDNAASGAGGGILMQNTVNTPWTLTVNNTLISGNHAGDAGGGIDTLGQGKVFINAGSQLLDNTCVNQGAAIWLDTINGVSATMTMTDALVSRNHAFAGPTGALGVAGNGAVTIIGTTVSDNYSGSTGGGFGDENGLANLTVSNSQFIDNVAMTDGGGIQTGGTGTLASITNTVIAGNTAGGNGGGVLASGGTLKITSTRIMENTATNGGGVQSQASILNVTNSTFDHNRAVGNADGNGGNGGAVAIVAGTGASNDLLANCLFLYNSASNGATSLGGAISDQASTLEVADCQLTSNYSSGSGGAIASTGASLFVFGSTLDHNEASAGSGGALFIATTTPSTVELSTLVGNTAGTSGGAIYDTAALSILADTINGNTSVLAGIPGGGGGIRTGTNVALTIGDTIIFGNNAGFSGPDAYTLSASVTDKGGNIIGAQAAAVGFGAGTTFGVDPLPGRLENHGGQMAGDPSSQQVIQTEALLPGSPAIGRGVNGLTELKLDERFFASPAAGMTNVSIGAYEPQVAADASANQVFVEGLYETILNRVADPGSSGFVKLLDQGGSPSTVIAFLENSTENRTNQVNALYHRYLHRNADPAGLQGFIAFLQHGGTIEQLSQILVSSPEYFQLHGSTNEAFVNALYIDALDRLPDAGGQAWFMQGLGSGQAQASVAAMVFASAEFQTNLVNTDFVSLLGRPADSPGLNFFVKALGQGATDEQIVESLLGSGEAFEQLS